MYSSITIPLILQILGVIIIIAEFLLPSAGLLTVAACCVFGYSLFIVFKHISAQAGFIFLVVDLIMIPILVIIGIKMIAQSPAALNKSLSKGDGVTSQDSILQSLIGKTGIVTSDLRPAGKALFEDKRFDVVSAGDYIAKNTPVIVMSVDGNRIVVKQTEKK